MCEQNDDITNNALFIACYAMSWPLHRCSARSERGTCLHSGSESWNLLVIGAMERAYCRSTFGVIVTSRNASEVFSPSTALHRCC